MPEIFFLPLQCCFGFHNPFFGVYFQTHTGECLNQHWNLQARLTWLVRAAVNHLDLMNFKMKCKNSNFSKRRELKLRSREHLQFLKFAKFFSFLFFLELTFPFDI